MAVPGRQHRDVLPAVGGEAPALVGQQQLRNTGPPAQVSRTRRNRRHRQRLRRRRQRDLIGQVAAPSDQDDRGPAEQAGDRARVGLVTPDDEHPARPLGRTSLVAGRSQHLEPMLEFFDIGRRPFVQEDEVDVEPLGAPKREGPHGLPGDVEIGLVADPQDDHREVARDPQRPDCRLRTRLRQDVRR